MAQTDKFRKGKSLFSTTLSSGISTGTGDTITLASVTGLPTDTEITLTFDRVDSDGNATDATMERITGTISGSNLTSYTRGVDGSSEQAHSSGAVVEYIWNGDDLNDMIDGLLVEHNQDGTHSDVTADSVTTDTIAGESSQFPAVTGIKSHGAVGSTETIDWSTGDRHLLTLDENVTISFSNAAAGQTITIFMLQDGSGTNTIAFGDTITWANDTTPTWTTTAGEMNIAVITYTGSAYYGVGNAFG